MPATETSRYCLSMHRELTITLDEDRRTGMLVARASGPADSRGPDGAWYAAAYSAQTSMGIAARAAAYGDDEGDAFPTADEAIADAVMRNRQAI